MVFQPRKVERSGLWDVVEGRVLIYVHKEQMLDDVERHYQARHYIIVDDKPRILTAMKRSGGRGSPPCSRVRDITPSTRKPSPHIHRPGNLTVESIGELVNYDLPALLGAAKADNAQQEVP